MTPKSTTHNAPDVVMAFRWNAFEESVVTFSGRIDADWQREAGKGTHATLSRFDMHNTLIATGPYFRPRSNGRIAHRECRSFADNFAHFWN